MDEPRRRRTLTPLQSELRAPAPPREPAPPTLLTRLRRRRTRRPPATLRRALLRAAERLALVVALASALAALVDHYLHRAASLGFYVVGAALLGVAVLMSAGDVGTPYYDSQRDRERRVSLSFSYVLAGVVVLGIAVAIDASGS